MAKIKSTLDLVMERTKNLTITEEEKEELRRKEWADRTRAWVRKILDRKMTMTELRSSLASGMASYTGVERMLREDLISHIDPDEDNAPIFHALQEVLRMDVEAIKESIRAYHDRLNLSYAEHFDQAKSDLGLRDISGTAVVPNLENNEAWAASVKRLKAEFRAQLKTL
jgi:hypothetical protein